MLDDLRLPQREHCFRIETLARDLGWKTWLPGGVAYLMTRE